MTALNASQLARAEAVRIAGDTLAGNSILGVGAVPDSRTLTDILFMAQWIVGEAEVDAEPDNLAGPTLESWEEADLRGPTEDIRLFAAATAVPHAHWDAPIVKAGDVISFTPRPANHRCDLIPVFHIVH